MKTPKVLHIEVSVKEQLDLLPMQPGVYLMQGAEGQILYVGKARKLARRVRSYFSGQPLHGPKIEKMVPLVRNIETIITDTEVEALVLEEQLIRKHQPRYNTLLKNSKGFPYLRLDWSKPYPRLEYAHRRRAKDQATYYGPYPSSRAVYNLLNAVRELFPVEKCKDPAKEKKVCIYYQIKRCMGHCQKKVTSEEYKDMLSDIRLFLDGKSDVLKERLKAKMLSHSEKQQYEQALQLRDTLKSLQQYILPAHQQKIVGKPEWNLDVIYLSRNALMCHMIVFPVREGLLQTPLPQTFSIKRHDENPEMMERFLYNFYGTYGDVPPEILLPFELESEQQDTLSLWLSELRGTRVTLRHPQRGDKRKLLAMAEKNADNGLRQAEKAQHYEAALEGLHELKQLLELEQLPERIEGFDISHFQGQDTVASMVVFEGGVPLKSDYRRFKIVSAEGKPDDFLSMQEVVTRRYQRLQKEGKSWPDLILIDGGKGQVSSAIKAFRKMGIQPPALIGLAKKEELIVLPDRKELIRLPRHSPGLRLLQQVRDESHRFAVSFQRQRRKKRTLDSTLNNIPGVGPRRQQQLLQRLGSVEKIRTAEMTELMLTGGLSRQVAQAVYQYFHPQEKPNAHP